ncbi:YkgJ family cysteine cluster protein [Maridesulfovibrio sp. FT414]|uniref:YkgJ family cysteine cluster protein n=1 Tax=Maridesulfovibrio sp. FT414 TaxID=2979469 RepID=UPI003D8074A3
MNLGPDEIIENILSEPLKLFSAHPEMQKLLRDMSLAVCADMNGIDPSHNLFPVLLAEKGCAQFEANFTAFLGQVQSLDSGFRVACGAGCSYCCSSHITLMPQEAFRIGLYLARNCTVDVFEDLAERCLQIEAELDRTTLEDFVGNYFRPCPFLVEDKCSIYEVRPILARNWISTDVEACIKSYNARNKITVPQNALIMIQKDLIYAGQAAYLADYGINGQICSFLPLMARIMTDFEGTYAGWLAGETLKGQLELK